MLDGELWLPIEGYEKAYWISTYGALWSEKTRRFLKASPNSVGYRQCTLIDPQGIRQQDHVHKLVARTWLGNRPSWATLIRHLDDNPLNNHVSNLAWGTHSENGRDTVDNGNHVFANQTHCIHGHIFDSINTYVTKLGHRACRRCHADRAARQRRNRHG